MVMLRHSDRLLIILLAVLIIIIIGIFFVEQIFGVKKDADERSTIIGEAFKRLEEEAEKASPETPTEPSKSIPALIRGK